MDITIEKKDGINIYYLSGELVVNTATQLEKKLIPAIDGGIKKVILEMSELNYISSAGLRTILQAVKKITPSGGKLVIAEPIDEVNEVFEIAGLTRVIPIYEKLKTALKNL